MDRIEGQSEGRSAGVGTINAILDNRLSSHAIDFLKKNTDFLHRVEFKDITAHPSVEMRSNEGHHDFDGLKHTIWMDRESPDFEGLMMHLTTRGILLEKGFPTTTCRFSAAFDRSARQFYPLLSAAIMDPVVDARLVEAGFHVYDRDILVERAMAGVWLDSRKQSPEDDRFLFCKWALFMVLLGLDPTFETQKARILRALISRKFPASWSFGDKMAAWLKKRGLSEPRRALAGMLILRSELKLQSKISIIDASGMRL